MSALGRLGTFPADSLEIADVAPPMGTVDPDEFVAAFSNVGPEIDLMGPGVAIVSTVPEGYGVMSGTSMACPAVTGAIARLLSADPATLALPADASRSKAIAKLALQAATSRGFPPELEGRGLLV